MKQCKCKRCDIDFFSQHQEDFCPNCEKTKFVCEVCSEIYFSDDEDTENHSDELCPECLKELIHTINSRTPEETYLDRVEREHDESFIGDYCDLHPDETDKDFHEDWD